MSTSAAHRPATAPPATPNRIRCVTPEAALTLSSNLMRAGHLDVDIDGAVVEFTADRRDAMDVAEYAWRTGLAPDPNRPQPGLLTRAALAALRYLGIAW